uniref:Uncharacterized protein n=1 Tax=Oryza brachyantha TaxID=4533 RepID=J3KXB2_ORYBR
MRGECNKDKGFRTIFLGSRIHQQAKRDLNSDLAQGPRSYCMQLTRTLVKCSLGLYECGHKTHEQEENGLGERKWQEKKRGMGENNRLVVPAADCSTPVPPGRPSHYHRTLQMIQGSLQQ